MERFRTPIVIEGAKAKTRSLRINIPRAIVDRLTMRGFLPPGWIRVQTRDIEPFFAYARRPPSRVSVDLNLPARFFPLTRGGQEIEVAVESAEPYRARPWTDAKGFDWLPFVDERYFPTETLDGKLVLHNRYEEPFVMKRVTPLPETWRLLGLYQAEGSKSAQAHDCSMAANNPELLGHAVKLFEAWGLGPERLTLEVLRGKDETPEAVRELFEVLGVEITAERIRSGKGSHAGVLHVQKSMPLNRLVCTVLDKLFKEELTWPDTETAREYALGWLDGDGCITITGPQSATIELRLAGYKDEQVIVLQALHMGFGWEIRPRAFGTPRSYTARTLDLQEAAELAAVGAFRSSANRARLIIKLEERITNYNEKTPGVTSPEAAHRAVEIFEKELLVEARALRGHALAATGFRTGIKGLGYPVPAK